MHNMVKTKFSDILILFPSPVVKVLLSSIVEERVSVVGDGVAADGAAVASVGCSVIDAGIVVGEVDGIIVLFEKQ